MRILPPLQVKEANANILQKEDELEKNADEMAEMRER